MRGSLWVFWWEILCSPERLFYDIVDLFFFIYWWWRGTCRVKKTSFSQLILCHDQHYMALFGLYIHIVDSGSYHHKCPENKGISLQCAKTLWITSFTSQCLNYTELLQSLCEIIFESSQAIIGFECLEIGENFFHTFFTHSATHLIWPGALSFPQLMLLPYHMTVKALGGIQNVS